MSKDKQLIVGSVLILSPGNIIEIQDWTEKHKQELVEQAESQSILRSEWEERIKSKGEPICKK